MKHFVIAVIILVITSSYVRSIGDVVVVPLLRPLHQFPTQIGSFFQVGEDQKFSDEIMEVLGVDHYIMREYRDQDGYSLRLYIGYYESQKEGRIIHSPKHCMPGGGWNIVQSVVVPISIPKHHGQLLVNKMILTKGGEKQLAYYWYQGRGRVIANEYKDRALMIYDSILRKRSDGALVRITGPGNDLDRDEKKQRELIESLIKVLPKYLPD